MKRKDELLIKFIKSVQLDTPSPDFTENVITFLSEESTLDEKIEIISEKNLGRNLLPLAPSDFSIKTMREIQDRAKKPALQPIVSLKTMAISILIIGYLFLVIDALFFNVLYLSDESFFNVEWFQALYNIPKVFWISMMVLTILILLDSIIKKNMSLSE
ncbi:hypothetical protein [Aquimarina litoralis]|uniref:hypothetical protein n=1 Tax=Aquimarina litoralis TaxID=584605 RepID=UPI001C5903A4|nr:hypothetical protein [Aquimarina litoralis]MBW1296409.1 hypothetical protein [Aquimarina litoralis]